MNPLDLPPNPPTAAGGPPTKKRPSGSRFRGWSLASLRRHYVWILAATTLVIVAFFQLDHPPTAMFTSFEPAMRWLIWALLGAIVATLGAFWLSYLKSTATSMYRRIVHHSDKQAMAQLLVFLTVITWLTTYVALSIGDYATRSTSFTCTTTLPATRTADPAQASPNAASLASTSTGSIQFGPWRGEGHAQVTLLAAAGTPAPAIEPAGFTMTALTSDDYLLPAQIGITATNVADRVLVDVCVDLAGLPRYPSGTYTAELLYHGADAQISPVPIEVTIQARYLWALLPALWILPVLAMWLVFDMWPVGVRRQLASFLAVAGPSAALFSTQGLARPGWGGGPVSIVGLLAAMYAAAVGAAELVKHGGHNVEEEADADVSDPGAVDPGLPEPNPPR